MTPTIDITTITQSDAQQALQDDGLDTLGLTSLALSTGWAGGAVAGGAYDAGELTLNVPNLHAPWRGILDSTATGADSLRDASGGALAGVGAIYRLHPAAIWRLETLMQQRYTDGVSPLLFPVPRCMAIRGATGFKSPQWYEPDADLALSGKISFHDGRGLVVDPIFVAALLADLLQWLPGLQGKTAATLINGDGGVQSIAALSNSTVIHLVDLHGNAYQPALPGATIITRTSAGAQSGTFTASGLANLGAGESIDSSGGDNGRLRWGWQTNGILGTGKIVPPALPTTGTPKATLTQQFYRVAAVDTVWALLGNRTGSSVLSIPGDDQKIPADLLPQVRDGVAIDYLADGPDTLARANAVLTRANMDMILASSPVIEGTMSIPTQTGINGHWPGYPAPNTNQGFPTPAQSVPGNLKAVWTSGFDIVVIIAKGSVPDGSHVRIYQQVFVTIPAITKEPSFVRGDGGAALASAGQDTQVLLTNPFALSGASPKPSNLTMDIVVMPRTGQRKIWSAVSVAIDPGPAVPPADPFSGVNPLSAMAAMFESVAPSPLFGIAATVVPPGGPPANVISFIRSLASEGVPRQGPRLPTMGRLETIVVTGTTAAADAPLLWEAVLTGGRWARESLSALHASGNPGNPAGPDVHAPGIHIGGGLAYDAARHAMRRAQPIIPVPGSPGLQLGWVVDMDGNNFNPPQDDPAANTGCGVFLETVAAVCESPELSVASPPAPGTKVQDVVDSISSALGVTPPKVTAANDVRIIGEIRREIVVSGNGLRDALWSLRRALREARELIYIESPQFARTARPAGTPTQEEVDLVGEIAASLQAHSNLKVIVCTPRESDFATKYRGWSRQHYRARFEAASLLLAAAPDRFALFHPVGFPGRTAFTRTTTVIVDDVWCLTGATHFRRRGMTFDGSAAVASFDRQMDHGYSQKVRAFRRALLAAKLAVPAPGTGTPSADWLRLGTPESSFQLVSDWLSEGGLGFIQPLWPGPSDNSVLAASNDMADPDGSDQGSFLGLFATLIAEAGD